MVGGMKTPTLMIAAAHDRQVPAERVRAMYDDIGSSGKVLIDLGCASHNAMWEGLARFLAVGAGNLVRRRMAAIGVLRFRFFLRDRTAAGLVRCLAALVRFRMIFAFAAGGVLLNRRRIRPHRWKLSPLLLFFPSRFSIADALLIVSHDASNAELAGTLPY
jgi:hypothetical protein